MSKYKIMFFGAIFSCLLLSTAFYLAIFCLVCNIVMALSLALLFFLLTYLLLTTTPWGTSVITSIFSLPIIIFLVVHIFPKACNQ